MIISEQDTRDDPVYSVNNQIYNGLKNYEPFEELISVLKKSTKELYPTSNPDKDDLYYAYYLICQNIKRYKFDADYQKVLLIIKIIYY
jgi:hypothetical protein